MPNIPNEDVWVLFYQSSDCNPDQDPNPDPNTDPDQLQVCSRQKIRGEGVHNTHDLR
jgi:hypothetical protein